MAEGPKDLVAVVLNGDCLDITFKAVPTANEYYIQASGDGYADTITVSSVDQVDGKFSKRIDSLTPNSPYSFVVTANVGGRNSTESLTSATTGNSIQCINSSLIFICCPLLGRYRIHCRNGGFITPAATRIAKFGLCGAVFEILDRFSVMIIMTFMQKCSTTRWCNFSDSNNAFESDSNIQIQ